MRPTREAVQQTLARLRSGDPTLKRFGAEGHGYRLNQPLTEAEAVAVEGRLGVALPAEYRVFVTRVGDGGAGPGYGIHPLRKLLAAGKKKSRPRAGAAAADPAVPFGRPVTTAEADRLDRFPVHGVIALCETGCGGEDCLVTAGIERGWVWSHMVGGRYLPAHPHALVFPAGATTVERARISEAFDAALLALSNTVRLGFWAWYRRWLEGMERDAEPGAGPDPECV